MRPKALECGTFRNGLCARFDRNRSAPVGFPMGAFPRHQGCREDAYAARSARCDPELHSRLGRKIARLSLYTLLQILSVTLFEKIPLHQAVTGVEYKPNDDVQCNQLNLFAF
jgi:hypothetical protein